MLTNCAAAPDVLGPSVSFYKYPVLLFLFLASLPLSVCRFWQARAVESFLRGATSYADQMFLLKRGLLEVKPHLPVASPLFVTLPSPPPHTTPCSSGATGCSLSAPPRSPPRQHILFCIIDSGCTSRDVLQSYFDLLGELMKFNIDAFKRFNKYVNTPEKVRPAGPASPRNKSTLYSCRHMYGL